MASQQAKQPDQTITVNRSDLETVMGGKATFDEPIQAGKANKTCPAGAFPVGHTSIVTKSLQQRTAKFVIWNVVLCKQGWFSGWHVKC